ncbi:unnamed protein product [Parnassius apollo]|uniref:(apollo) hypothetical protein n=1 Tax=Parnassius apollo TaxID=110799 RepID=A0A8S3W807_PARAO|nr:unnamed protein product [Parnassius apollo]
MAKNHTANDRRCPVLRRIPRKQGIALPGLLPEEPKRVLQSRPRAVVQEDGWTTIRGKGRQPAPPPPVTAPIETVVPTTTTSKATTGATLQPPANDAIERQTSQRSPEEPTHVPTDPRSRPDVLDIVLARNINHPIVVEVLYDLDSQHLPILITLGLKAVTTLPRTVKTRVDWRLYHKHLQERPPAHHPLNTADDVEAAATNITKAIQEALNAASTIVPMSTRRDVLPRHISVQIRRKRALRRLWARSRCPRIKTLLNTLSEELSVAVQAHRGDAWERRIWKAEEHDASLYKLNRQLTKAKPPVCPLTNNAGERRYDAKGRADILVEHFEKQFMPNPASAEFMKLHAQKESRVHEFLSSPAPPLAGKWFISPR